MPNSLFRSPEPECADEKLWFVIRLKDMGFGGPLTAEGLQTGLASGKLAWTDVAYAEGTEIEWVRLFEVEELKKFFPPFPAAEVLGKYEIFADKEAPKAPALVAVPPPSKKLSRDESRTIKNARATAPAPVEAWLELLTRASHKVPRAHRLSSSYWYLLLAGKEVGPVELADIENASKLGRAPRSAFGWNTKLRRWLPFGAIPELAKYSVKGSLRVVDQEPDFVIERGAQKRRAIRKSLVAAVFQLNPSAAPIMVGICGDISADGFQLIEYDHKIDHTKGTRFIFEIRTSKTSSMVPFKISAIVKWYDPNRNLIGFEFDMIDPVDRKLLAKFTSPLT